MLDPLCFIFGHAKFQGKIGRLGLEGCDLMSLSVDLGLELMIVCLELGMKLCLMLKLFLGGGELFHEGMDILRISILNM